MKCPECEKEGKVADKVFYHGGSSTLMMWNPYWDKDGNYHNNDPNIHTSSYQCTNGHGWTENRRGGKLIVCSP